MTACGSMEVRLRRCAMMSWRRYTLAFVALLLVTGWVGVTSARASSCVENLSTSVVTCTFSFTGGEQTFSVPAGVSSVMVQAVGAPGGKLTDAHFGSVLGGSGAVVTGPLTVTPREKLYIEVGGAGDDYGSYGTPGFNGGGTGSYFAAGGGGASDVRTSALSTGLSHDTRLLIAGGGGGAGAASYNPHPDTAGGHGGSAGVPGGTANGADFDLTGGGGGAPGSATQGGAGGQGGIPGSACAGNLDPPGCTTGNHGSAGVLGVGGAGGTGGVKAPPGGGGGGGGGGLYGGGGGGAGAFGTRSSIDATGPGGGGGGGSSSVPAGGSVTTNTTALPPEVMISYTAPAGLGAPPVIPRLHLEIAGPRAAIAGKLAHFRIRLSRSAPRVPIRNVRVISRHAGHRLREWHVATLPLGHSRRLHLTMRIPSSARGRFCITTTAVARHARSASGRDCVNLVSAVSG